jgi:hypothetical protein
MGGNKTAVATEWRAATDSRSRVPRRFFQKGAPVVADLCDETADHLSHQGRGDPARSGGDHLLDIVFPHQYRH